MNAIGMEDAIPAELLTNTAAVLDRIRNPQFDSGASDAIQNENSDAEPSSLELELDEDSGTESDQEEQPRKKKSGYSRILKRAEIAEKTIEEFKAKTSLLEAQLAERQLKEEKEAQSMDHEDTYNDAIGVIDDILFAEKESASYFYEEIQKGKPLLEDYETTNEYARDLAKYDMAKSQFEIAKKRIDLLSQKREREIQSVNERFLERKYPDFRKIQQKINNDKESFNAPVSVMNVVRQTFNAMGTLASEEVKYYYGKNPGEWQELAKMRNPERIRSELFRVNSNLHTLSSKASPPKSEEVVNKVTTKTVDVPVIKPIGLGGNVTQDNVVYSDGTTVNTRAVLDRLRKNRY